MNKKIVISLSGGMDSATLFSKILEEGSKPIPIVFSYGSKHGRWENDATRRLCHYYETTPYFVDLSIPFGLFRSDLLRSGGPIPEGHYNDASMSKTVVPGRNTIFISFMLGLALSMDASEIAIGVHAGDHHIYPDCRPAYIEAMRNVVTEASEGKVQLIAPFLQMTKGQIVAAGIKYKTPYHLTRTCYKDQMLSCGRCGSCSERLEAFAENSIKDPILYEEVSL